jgi:hypothetical protein
VCVCVCVCVYFHLVLYVCAPVCIHRIDVCMPWHVCLCTVDINDVIALTIESSLLRSYFVATDDPQTRNCTVTLPSGLC